MRTIVAVCVYNEVVSKPINPRLEQVATLVEQGAAPKEIKEHTGVGYTEVMAAYRWFRIFTGRGWAKRK